MQAAVASIRFESTAHGNRAFFEIDQQRDAPVVRITASAPTVPTTVRSAGLGVHDRATLLVKELNRAGEAVCYEAALAQAGRLAALARAGG
jgi:hypothetical protein